MGALVSSIALCIFFIVSYISLLRYMLSNNLMLRKRVADLMKREANSRTTKHHWIPFLAYLALTALGERSGF